MQRKRSEEVSEFVGYWLCENGSIMERKTGMILPVYANGTSRLKKEDGRKENVVAHRLIAKAFVAQPEGYDFVKFKDGNRSNRSANNLQWTLGVKEVGEQSLEMIKLWELGSSSMEIAHAFNFTPQYVNRVIRDHKARIVDKTP